MTRESGHIFSGGDNGREGGRAYLSTSSSRRAHEQDPRHQSPEILSMSLHQPVQSILVLGDQLFECRPRALDDLELVERLELSNEVGHLGVDQPTVMPVARGA